MKRNIIAICILLVFVGAYLYTNNFFRKEPIQITPSIRPGRPSRVNPEVYPVSFLLDNKYRLKSVKVVTREDAEKSKYPRPLWHMVSDSASRATKMIIYGMPIPGMKPAIPKARPEPLQPNVPYRLIIEAEGGYTGYVDFKTVEAVTTPQNQRG